LSFITKSTLRVADHIAFESSADVDDGAHPAESASGFMRADGVGGDLGNGVVGFLEQLAAVAGGDQVRTSSPSGPVYRARLVEPRSSFCGTGFRNDMHPATCPFSSATLMVNHVIPANNHQ
jgi:hypothetical protein